VTAKVLLAWFGALKAASSGDIVEALEGSGHSRI
jgi:hypothetical protein